MPATQVAITAPRPTSPLNYKPVKGEFRMVEDRLWQWNGADWVPAVVDSRDIGWDPSVEATLNNVATQDLNVDQNAVFGTPATEAADTSVALVRGNLNVTGQIVANSQTLGRGVIHQRLFTSLSAQTLSTTTIIPMQGEGLAFTYEQSHKYQYKVSACYTGASNTNWVVRAYYSVGAAGTADETSEPFFYDVQPLGSNGGAGRLFTVDAWLPLPGLPLVDGTQYNVVWALARVGGTTELATRFVSSAVPQTHTLIDHGV